MVVINISSIFDTHLIDKTWSQNYHIHKCFARKYEAISRVTSDRVMANTDSFLRVYWVRDRNSKPPTWTL
jgi:hypothetical protein